MPDITIDRSMLELIKEFQQLAEGFTSKDRTEIAQAIRSFITAKSYLDEVLLVSAIEAMWSSLAVLVEDFVKNELTKASGTQQRIRQGWTKFVEGQAIPGENFNRLRTVIRSLIDDRIAAMTNLRDNLVRGIVAQGLEIENAQELEDSIEEMYRFREGLAEFLRPRKRPAINKEAIERARAVIGQKERWRGKDDMIRRDVKDSAS